MSQISTLSNKVDPTILPDENLAKSQTSTSCDQVELVFLSDDSLAALDARGAGGGALKEVTGKVVRKLGAMLGMGSAGGTGSMGSFLSPEKLGFGRGGFSQSQGKGVGDGGGPGGAGDFGEEGEGEYVDAGQSEGDEDEDDHVMVESSKGQTQVRLCH